MKTIFVTLIALLISLPATAQTTEAQLRNDVCTVWAKNAMYGANQRVRGAKREARWITMPILMELIEHGMGAEALYFMDNDYTPLQREWILSSTLEGYDWMNKRYTPTGQLPDPAETSKQFLQTCLDNPKHYQAMAESLAK